MNTIVLPRDQKLEGSSSLDKSPFMERRRSLTVLAGSVALGWSPWLQAQAVQYQLLTLSKTNLPMSVVADCKALEASVKQFDAEVAKALADPAGHGKAVLARLTARRSALQSSIAAAKKAHGDADLDLTLKHVNNALSVMFFALGVAFSGPVAFGTLAAATVLTGVAAFGVQAAFLPGAKEPAMVFGFARDRTLMFAQLGAKDAATTVGKLVGKAAGAAALFIAAYEYYKTYSDRDKARSALALAVPELQALDAALSEMGTDPKAWGEMSAKVHAAARDGLSGYIDKTRTNNCMLSPSSGPVLRRP